MCEAPGELEDEPTKPVGESQPADHTAEDDDPDTFVPDRENRWDETC